MSQEREPTANTPEEKLKAIWNSTRVLIGFRDFESRIEGLVEAYEDLYPNEALRNCTAENALKAIGIMDAKKQLEDGLKNAATLGVRRLWDKAQQIAGSNLFNDFLSGAEVEAKYAGEDIKEILQINQEHIDEAKRQAAKRGVIKKWNFAKEGSNKTAFDVNYSRAIAESVISGEDLTSIIGVTAEEIQQERDKKPV